MITPEQTEQTSIDIVELSNYTNTWYKPGRGLVARLLWHYVNVLVIQNPLNISSTLKVAVLRAFGANIGVRVNIKPGVNVKYPWNVQIGDYSWIGERVWLDSLAPISIGSHACISQDAYLCTGNHDWTDATFGLMIKPIVIEDGVWVGARSTILSGVTLASHSVVTAGSVVSQSTKPYTIYVGNPAVEIKKRAIRRKTT